MFYSNVERLIFTYENDIYDNSSYMLYGSS